MKTGGELLTILALAALLGAGTWHFAGSAPAPPACDPTALSPGEVCLESVRDDPGILWIDARTEAEWRRDGLPGSIHLTTVDGAFDEGIAANGDRLATAERAVVYCGDLGCGISKEVAGRLRDYGLIPDALALHGGWAALRAAGLLRDSSPEP